MPMKRFTAALAWGIALTAVAATDVSFFMCYRPNRPEDPATKALNAFEGRNPGIHLPF